MLWAGWQNVSDKTSLAALPCSKRFTWARVATLIPDIGPDFRVTGSTGLNSPEGERGCDAAANI